MKVSRILQGKGSEVTSVAPDTPILDVVQTLRDRRVGAVVVLHEDETIAGILSERDVVHALAEHGPDLARLVAGDLMTPEVTVCDPNDDLHQVMRQMSGGRFRHVPVVADGRLRGIMSIGDVVRARIDELERETEALQHYISG